MVYFFESLERQGRISSSLSEAIGNELEISDLFTDGLNERSPLVQQCYDVSRQLSEELTYDEKLVLGGVAKQLWKLRVKSNPDPTSHPEYRETMESEVETALLKFKDISEFRLFEDAQLIIESLDVTPQISQAA